MTPRDLRNIHTTRNSCRDTLPHGTKTIPVFLAADGEASWLLLPSSVSSLSGDTVQPENTYYCILKVTGSFWIPLKIVFTKIWNSKSKTILKINREWKYNLRDVEDPVKYLWWSIFAKKFVEKLHHRCLIVF